MPSANFIVCIGKSQEMNDQMSEISREHLSLWFYHFYPNEPSQCDLMTSCYLKVCIGKYQEMNDQMSEISREHLSFWCYHFYPNEPSQ